MKHKKKEYQFNIKLFSTHQILMCYVIITTVIKEDLLSTLNFLNNSSLTFGGNSGDGTPS